MFRGLDLHGKDTNFKFLRFQCFQWTQHHIDLLQFRRRTKEIIYLILDCLLSKLGNSLENPELVCIVCICFGAKLETDFSRQFCDFLDYILNERGINVSQIKRLECEILLSLPDCFGIIVPFADIIDDFVHEALADLNTRLGLVDTVYSSYLKSLASHGPSEGLLNICVALLSPTTSQRKQGLEIQRPPINVLVHTEETFLGKRAPELVSVPVKTFNMQKKLKKLKA